MCGRFPMNIPAIITLCGSALALYGALMLWPFSLVARWRNYRGLQLVAITGCLYIGLDVPSTLDLPPALYVWGMKVQLAAALVHSFSWLRHSRLQLAIERSEAAAWLERGLLAGAALILVPGVGFTGLVAAHPVAWLSATYHDAEPTWFGAALFFFPGVALFPALLRYLRAIPSGLEDARTMALAVAALMLGSLTDSGTTVGLISLPYLLDIGILCEITALGLIPSRAWARDSRRLEETSARLAEYVLSQGKDLTAAQRALEKSERLASLGRIAAGVAHEINNPVAALTGNIQYLREEARAGSLPADADAAMDDCLHAAQRISTIARQLLVSGRAAAQETPDESFDIGAALDRALRIARETVHPDVRIECAVPPGLHLIGRAAMLEQVVVNLVVNGAQAMPAGRRGLVRITSEEREGRIRLTVSDDGVGFTAEARAHLFEPFFTTKPFGEGTGLGLSVSRGLVRTLGGELHVESAPGVGTAMIIDLPAAAAPSGPQTASLTAPRVLPALVRRRLLLVDDERPVLEALQRVLGAHFEVRTSGGVESATELLRGGEAFDLVLCDVMMPGGGGAELYRRMPLIRKSLAQRIIFLTGGATTAESLAFLERQPQPVLEKPLDVAALVWTAERLCEG